MATAFRNPLGKSLASMIMPGDQADYGMPRMPAPMGTPPQQQSGGLFKQGSKGQIIAGIIGDTLASLSGGAPVFTQSLMQQRQRDQDMQAQEAQWTRRREADREDKQWEWQNKPREDDAFSAMMRSAGIDPASDAGKAFYAQRLQKQVAEPDVITTLPNGQLYAGPRSGLAQALTGGIASVAKPVGKLTPIAGGPTPASGTFRP